MSIPSAEVAADFRDALQDLKQNSRPEINNLTIIAKENTEHAQAISHELESHIKATRPEFKLPALYVLDSIVKNVGTPYTVYLGRNLYRTFMDAYLVMNESTRKAMEGLLRTWKQPVPESMDPRPVFSPEVTGDIENALNKIRSVQVQSTPAHRPVHALPPRPAAIAAWRNTPTPPQNGARQSASQDPRIRAPYPPVQQFGLYPPSMPAPNPYGQPQSQNEPVSSVDLEDLKTEVAKSISDSQQAFAYNPADANLKQRLDALIALKTMLNTKALTPASLRDIQTQIRNLAPLPGPAPMPTFNPPTSIPPPNMHSQLHSAPPVFPPASAPPINIAQLLANMRPPMPPVTNPAAAPSTPNLADLLRRVSSPAQSSSTPAVASFYPPPFPVPPPISTPVQAPAVPAPAPAGTPTANLAQLLAQFSKPAAAPPAPVTQPVPPFPVSLPQLLSQPPVAGPVPGSAEWLLNALKVLPTNGTPSNTTPMASEPMTRQSSAPTSVLNEVELTTASMKKPRLHLISRLYEAYSNQCASCGRRFENTPQGKEKKARHMDWHFKVKDPQNLKRAIHRSWYISEKEWVEYRETDETSPDEPTNGSSGTATAVKKQAKDRYVPVPQDAAIAQAPCAICQERFETQWLVEANDFVWMDAIQVGGKIYHATCWEEYSKGAGIPMPSTPERGVLGKRKAEVSTPTSGKKPRAY
ncbi:hypothetical protein K458DRAFT_151217 [Lentithecium fluviatile CBS 122367]|uniref:CID domain-containing protein n=1 Tax=Lentithecium fluviatile CBS 122367 TaxID=1168545 RepID=A0A6G1JDR3_9PLEO|nr:hypothetical protein K458DRAFT_151217 [Lentithecium fluviatile CBS 122367]